jgi:hypothetical protein
VITLRIEHAIHDYDRWKAAFDSFAQVRQIAGVRSHAIRRPVEDPHYLMLDLEFDAADAAEEFALFLEERVWSSTDSAPALAGVPRTRVLERQEDVAGGDGRPFALDT